MMESPLFGGVEGGGTKFVCAVGNGSGELLDEISIPTTTPAETLGKAIAFLQGYSLAGIGIACFGPLELDPASRAHGSILNTPKTGWSGTRVLEDFRQAINVPLAFDLDVNAAALGEYTWVPENKGLASLAYFTIGTGIGAGFVQGGKVMHGLTHPEAGHVRLPHDLQKDPFAGVCPFHGDCFEGLASGTAMAKRWKMPAEMLPHDHPGWELEASYIALALVNVILTVSPQRILLGGGVMQQHRLFPLIRARVRSLLNGYISSSVLSGSLESYILPPSLGRHSGVLGALAMGMSLVGAIDQEQK